VGGEKSLKCFVIQQDCSNLAIGRGEKGGAVGRDGTW